MNKKIISLTTISSRSEIVRYTIASLLNQSIPADEIHLNVSSDPYLIDEGYASLPLWLSVLEEQNKIIINFVKNIGPYRKLIPLINSLEKDDIIVICDDDVIYSYKWFESLIEESVSNPEKVICGYAKRIKRITNHLAQSYLYWPEYKGCLPKSKLVPIGVGGVLYKPSFFDLDRLNNTAFLTVAMINDDFWFWHSLKKSTNILSVTTPTPLFYSITTRDNLFRINYSFTNNIFRKIINKSLAILGYFGFTAMANDKVYKDLSKLGTKDTILKKPHMADGQINES